MGWGSPDFLDPLLLLLYGSSMVSKKREQDDSHPGEPQSAGHLLPHPIINEQSISLLNTFSWRPAAPSILRGQEEGPHLYHKTI
ncbi:hypothetical protein EYF80_068432 [Liparis tanakae]|uniref:Uncharacterized protein n=1 Tax=Liparis tanakae TaxID=230148 RepID=A0A4Z2DYG8_9TELE|nr:hypothetical protein EYF80_068432 [Liparis tanakae]